MKNLKMNTPKEITREDAQRLINENCPYVAHEFANLHESDCKNQTYHLVKIGKKGSIFNGYSGMEKAEKGVFAVVLTWDFSHPANFTQDANGLEKIFHFVL